MRPPPIIVLAAVLAALVALPAAALAQESKYDEDEARYDQEVGVGDQSVLIFGQQPFDRLAIDRVRLNVSWNLLDGDHEDELRKVQAYLARAQAEDVAVLVHLTDGETGPFAGELPTPEEYADALDELIPFLREYGVFEFGVWNEANHKSQPTDRHPDRAAEFFIAMYREVFLDEDTGCEYPDCRVVALDVLDEGDVHEYVDAFYDRLNRRYDRRAETVGIHNYSSVNRFRNAPTSKMIRAFIRERGRDIDIWATETGGLMAFGSEDGDFFCDNDSERSVERNEERQDRAIRWMFQTMRTYDRYLDRLYVYNWFGTDCRYDGSRGDDGERFNLFDAGLVTSTGEERDAYYEFLRRARDYRR